LSLQGSEPEGEKNATDPVVALPLVKRVNAAKHKTLPTPLWISVGIATLNPGFLSFFREAHPLSTLAEFFNHKIVRGTQNTVMSLGKGGL